MSINQGFETIVGLEVHVQLNSKTKAFCSDKNVVTTEANTYISPISLAYPGTLPRINEKQIEKAIKLGLALGCDIASYSAFDRKNYFYPDLPKGYQITQDRYPICTGGEFTFDSSGKEKTIRIHHIHMEEDAGKSIHGNQSTLIDYNRAGTPLLEVVTEPDFRSGQEVSDFMAQFQVLLRFLEISDANMEEGSLRCDCNVSVKPLSDSKLGTRCEIKNLNSKRFAKNAVEYESQRQISNINKGEAIRQESRLFDPSTGQTYSMRKKEDALDYRYFPDPDLQIIHTDDDTIKKIKGTIGLLPRQVQLKLMNDHGISGQNAALISQEKSFQDLFAALTRRIDNPKMVANFIVNQIMPLISDSTDLQALKYEKQWIELLGLIQEGKLSASTAFQQLIPEILDNPDTEVIRLAEKHQLLIAKGSLDYEAICGDILSSYPEKVDIFRKGRKGLMGFFIGEAMKKGIKGLDPKELQKHFESQLNEN